MHAFENQILICFVKNVYLYKSSYFHSKPYLLTFHCPQRLRFLNMFLKVLRQSKASNGSFKFLGASRVHLTTFFLFKKKIISFYILRIATTRDKHFSTLLPNRLIRSLFLPSNANHSLFHNTHWKKG